MIFRSNCGNCINFIKDFMNFSKSKNEKIIPQDLFLVAYLNHKFSKLSDQPKVFKEIAICQNGYLVLSNNQVFFK